MSLKDDAGVVCIIPLQGVSLESRSFLFDPLAFLPLRNAGHKQVQKAVFYGLKGHTTKARGVSPGFDHHNLTANSAP